MGGEEREPGNGPRGPGDGSAAVVIPGERGEADLPGVRRLAPPGARVLIAIVGAVALGIAVLLLGKAHRMRQEPPPGRRALDRIEKRVPGLSLAPLPAPARRASAEGALPGRPAASAEVGVGGEDPPPPAPRPGARSAAVAADGGGARRPPGDPARERRLAPGFGGEGEGEAPGSAAAAPPSTAAPARGRLEEKLEAPQLQGSAAAVLADRDRWLTQGTVLDCVLETRMVSTVPGLATCHLTRDAYSASGRVVLLDRGTRLVGRYQGGVQQGEARIFVLWTRAETPAGVLVTLDSPGTGALGEAGVGGGVDQHFWDRFGAAMVVSLVEGATDAASARLAGPARGATVNVGGAAGATRDVVSKTLESTVDMPPTVYVNQGERIGVLVARDLDFRGVYGLERVARDGE